MKQQRLFVLRPGIAGAQLSDDINSLSDSVNARHAPTIAIKPLPFEQIKESYYRTIFISPNAVCYSKQSHELIKQQSQTIIAVGSGTAEQLTNFGFNDVLLPDMFNTEGLLNMSELDQVHNQRILIVKGRGGRPLLHDTLLLRGARCDLLNVYDREQTMLSVDQWQWYCQKYKRGLAVASLETLMAFEKQRQQFNYPLPDIILVASDRIAEVASSLGYTDVMTVGGAANHFFITAMEEYLKAHD